MILSLDLDIGPSPTQKISHEPFPFFSCFFNKVHNLTISFSCSLHPALQGYSGPPYPFSLLSHKRLMPLLPSIFSHIQYQKDIMQKKTGTPIKEFRPHKA